MSSEEIRSKFLEFFKKRGHAIVPSSSLIPDDPSVLLTTAGMQQFKPYYTGQLDPEKTIHPSLGRPVGKNAASIQKSFRTSDIDEVGDESHLTFFEMLGNFSFGGYWKKGAIEYGYEFITGKDWMGLTIDKVTVFDPVKVPADDWRKGVPFDRDSYEIWKKILPEEKIFREGVDNFWGPTGAEGPCGPTTEIYVKNKQGKSIEIWNIVFNEYYCSPDKHLEKLKISGVDTGMGLERLAMVSQDTPTIFETDLFSPFNLILRGGEEDIKSGRIIADHIRGAVFLIANGVVPSNKEAGYILRRLIRRAMIHANKAEIKENIFLLSKDILVKLINDTIDFYSRVYVELAGEREHTLDIFEREVDSFGKTLRNGLREFNGRYPGIQAYTMGPDGSYGPPFIVGQKVGKDAFDLYQTYGFPIEVIKELLEDRLYKFNHSEFQEKLKEEFEKQLKEEFEKHQEISRAGLEKKFGGHGLLLDTGEIKAGNEEEFNKALRLHTATHLLHWALREVLGKEVHQMGSDITPERSRFDFTFSRKLTPEEIQKIENLINEKVKEDLPVNFKEMPKTEAEKTGALHFFKLKYPDVVKVYYIGKELDNLDNAVSKEFCGGPHVKHTREIGEVKVLKEEAVSAGVRRIRIAVK